jgi:hypothetical protein
MMQGWWIKKWFRGMAKWLIYYAAACVLTYIAIRVFEDHLVEEITSLVPLCAMVLMLGYAVYIRVLDNFESSMMSMKFSKEGGHASLSFRSPGDYDNGAKAFSESLFLLCAPLPLPFIYFFPAHVKLIGTGICVALPLCILTVLFLVVFVPIQIKLLRQNRLDNIAFEQRRADEMKKQREKESLGEWKR